MASVLAGGNPPLRAGEDAFRPLPTTSTADGSLTWRSRVNVTKTSTKVVPSATFVPARHVVEAQRAVAEAPVAAPAPARQPPRQPSKVQPPPRETTYPANRISSRQTRSRLRDSVMQVSTYQDAAAEAQPADAVRDPFELNGAAQAPGAEAPAPVPPDAGNPPPAEDLFKDDPIPATPPARNELPPGDERQLLEDFGTSPAEKPGSEGPPAMPNTIPEDQPLPADDLFKDDPIPTPPRSEYELPDRERDQLLEGIGTAPGEPGCANQKEECQRALRQIQKRDITTITVGILIEGVEGTDFPCDCKLGRDFDAPAFAGRDFAPTLFTWKASGTCHKPLYFEDVRLERYGHSWNPIFEPFVSGAHFFVSVPLLPYKMGLRPPNECVYTLGYYRPGNCAPYMLEPIPLSLRAAAFEAAGATAFAFWFWPPN